MACEVEPPAASLFRKWLCYLYFELLAFDQFELIEIFLIRKAYETSADNSRVQTLFEYWQTKGPGGGAPWPMKFFQLFFLKKISVMFDMSKSFTFQIFMIIFLKFKFYMDLRNFG